MSRTRTNGDFTVGGDPKRRPLPTVGAALSLACNLATRATAADTFGVYRNGDRVATVERDEHGRVTARMAT